MDYTNVMPYFATVVVYAVAPGPLMAVLIVRSLSSDFRGAGGFAAGLCTGMMIVAGAVAFGVGVWAETSPVLLALIKYFGVAYLLWLAAGTWNSVAGINGSETQAGSLFGSAFAGIALCVGNPTTLLMYLLMVPILAPDGAAGYEQMVLVVMVTFAAASAVFFGTILMARQLNRIIAAPQSSILFNRITSGTMALTSVWILAA
jgi:threonine/homoserine/homoserine lactone efflux protein